MAGHFIENDIFRRETVFSPAQADPLGRVLPEATALAFQDIATEHYETLGLGRAVSDARGCFWALARSDTEYLATVPAGTPLYLDTCTGKQAHGLFWRHYRIMTPEGTELVRSVGTWLLMDVVTRSMVLDCDWITEKGGHSLPGQLPATLRRPPVPEELPRRAERTVTDAEADINGHLNNTLYLRWCGDLLEESFASSHRLRRLWIEYKKELPLGARTALTFALEGGTLFVRGFHDDKEAFSARCEYDPV